MRRPLRLAILLFAIVIPSPALAEPVALTSASPATLSPVRFGESKTQRVVVYGSGLRGPTSAVGHDPHQWEHYQLRLNQNGVAGPWVVCRFASLDFHGCRIPSGTANFVNLEIGGGWLFFLKLPTNPALELRFWWGLAAEDAVEPADASSGTPSVSNILRIPIADPTPPSIMMVVPTPTPTPKPTPRPPEIAGVHSAVAGVTLATTLMTVTCTTPILADRSGTPVMSKTTALEVKEGQTVYAFSSTVEGPSGRLRAIDLGARAWVAANCLRVP